MKINWDAKITNFEGQALKDGDKEITMATLACGVFMTALRGDENLSDDEKEGLFKIGLAAAKGGIGDITTEQATALKKRIGKAYAPLIVGRAFEIIEGRYDGVPTNGSAIPKVDTDAQDNHEHH